MPEDTLGLAPEDQELIKKLNTKVYYGTKKIEAYPESWASYCRRTGKVAGLLIDRR